jgi:murein L,D-transpeptidase YafK
MRIFLQLMMAIAVNLLVPTAGVAATIAERLEQYGPAVRARLGPFFQKNGVAYPPTQIAFVGLKQEKVLQVYARNGTNGFAWIRSYPILAASGGPGPKLREGDWQVPEGIYGIESLNPNSHFHLSLRVNYPNAFDREQARKENRTTLGGDIMIHGNAVSTGCLAMGDEAAEDLFVLAADTGLKNITVILAPVDLREKKTVTSVEEMPKWTASLYETLRTQLKQFPKEHISDRGTESK